MFQEQEPSFWEKYGPWIAGIAFIALAACVYLGMKDGKKPKVQPSNKPQLSRNNGIYAAARRPQPVKATKATVITGKEADQIRARQRVIQTVPPPVQPVDPSKLKVDPAKRAPIKIQSSRQPLRTPPGPQDKLNNQIPEGDVWLRMFDRYLEPNTGRDKIENGWLVTRTKPSGVWTYKGNHLTFDFDSSPFGACLSTNSSNRSLATVGMNTNVQVCDKGRPTFVYRDGKILFDGHGYLLLDMEGIKIDPQKATAFDIIQKS